MSVLLHTNYNVKITYRVFAFTGSWKLLEKVEDDLEIDICFVFIKPFVKCVSEQLASPLSSSSSGSDQSGQKFIKFGGRSSGFTLALYLLDFTLNRKELNGLQPCQKNALHKTELPEAIAQENKHKRLCTVRRHLISIYFVLLNYSGVFFILAVSFAGFISVTHPVLHCKL